MTRIAFHLRIVYFFFLVLLCLADTFYNYFLLQLLRNLWFKVEISQTKMAQVEKVYMVKNLKMKTFIIRYSVENSDSIQL